MVAGGPDLPRSNYLRADLAGSERLGGVNTVGIHACTRTQFDSMFSAVGEQVLRSTCRAGSGYVVNI